MMKKVALIGGLLALLSVGSAFAAGQFPGYPLATAPLTGFEYIPADTGAVASGASFTGAISGTTLTATGITGNIYAGQNIVGANVAPGTMIVSGSGGTWTVNNSQTVASTAMTSGGGGVNPQTEMVQVQQLRSYVLSGGGSVSTYIKLPISTTAALPTCAAALNGVIAAVSDGTAYAVGVYGAAATGGGIVTRQVICTNTAGAAVFAWAYN